RDKWVLDILIADPRQCRHLGRDSILEIVKGAELFIPTGRGRVVVGGIKRQSGQRAPEVTAGSGDEGALVQNAGAKVGWGEQCCRRRRRRWAQDRGIPSEILLAKGIPQLAVEETIKRFPQIRGDRVGVDLCLLV